MFVVAAVVAQDDCDCGVFVAVRVIGAVDVAALDEACVAGEVSADVFVMYTVMLGS